MTRRRDPFPIRDALEGLLEQSRPNTPLAVVQGVWSEAVGETIAGWAVPVSERNGVLTVHCTDSVTAHQLNSMQLEILAKVRGAAGSIELSEIRFRVGSPGN